MEEVYNAFIKEIPSEQKRNADTHKSLSRCLIRELPKGTKMSDMEIATFSKFLNNYKNPVTRNSKRARLKAMVGWAVKRGVIRYNPLDAIDPLTEVYKEPSFFYPDKVEKIMRVVEDCAGPSIGMVFVLGFFAGMRSSEIARSKWEDIDLDNKSIRIPRPKGATQGARPRIVELEESTLAWISKFMSENKAKPDELIIPAFWRSKEWKKAKLAPLDLSWGNDENHNVMRHTYATMHVAAFRNAPSTAINLGHGRGTEMLDKHYKGLVASREAEKYWKILPSTNLLPHPDV